MGLIRVALRELAAHPGRNLLSLLGVALGVVLIVAVSLVNRSTGQAFSEMVDALTGEAVLQVEGGEAGFPEDVLEIVKAEPGVRTAAPLIIGNVFLDDASGQSLLVMGVDVLQEAGVRRYRGMGADEAPVDDPLVFLNSPDSVIITRALADQRGLAVGDKLDVLTAVGRRTLVVRGLLRPDGVARAIGENLAVMDVFAAQILFGKERKFDRISIILEEGAEIDAVARALSARLPQGLTVEHPQTRRVQMDARLAGFQYSLAAGSTFALLIGLCMVYNAVSTSVVRRQREVGVLRAAGGRQREIVGVFLLEAALLGLLGSILGWAGGLALAQGLTAAVQSSMETSFAVSLGPPTVAQAGPGEFLKALAGVLAAMLAAWGPARRASRVAAVEALRPGLLERMAEGRQGRTALLGCAALVVSIVCIAIGAATRGKLLLAASTGALFFSFVVVAASGVVLLASRSRDLLSALFGVTGAIVAASIARNPRRTAFTAAVVAIGMTVHVLFATMRASIEGNILADVRSELGADLVAFPTFLESGRLTPPVDGALADTLRALDGVRDVAVVRRIPQDFRGNEILIQAHSPSYFSDPEYGYEKPFLAGNREAGIRAVIDDGAIFVSHNFAFLYDVGPGDEVTLAVPTGLARLKVAAVVSEHISNTGTIMLSRDTFLRLWGDPLVSEFHILLKPGADAEVVKKEIMGLTHRDFRLRVLLVKEFLDFASARVDRVFAFTKVLQLIILAVVLLSLADTLLVSVLGRTREIGVLRAVGARRREVFRMVMLEGSVITGLGAAIGIIGGSLIAVLWMRVHFKYLFGWIMETYFPPAALVSAGVLIVVTVMAALYPARRASRLSVVKSLAYE
jgi:putative ABC transport system permease protein